MSFFNQVIRKPVLLNGSWDFTFTDTQEPESLKIDSYTDKLMVPCAFDAMPAYEGKRGLGIYRKEIYLESGKIGLLHFGGAGMRVWVYADDEQIGYHEGSYTGLTCIVPKSENPNREIRVVCDNRFNFEKYKLQENFFDFYQYGGIFRDVTFAPVEDLHINNIHVETIDHEAGKIKAKIFLRGIKVGSLNLEVAIDGGVISKEVDTPVVDGMATIELKVADPKLWSPETPNLHTIYISTGGDDMSVRFGLRKIETKGREILLNGKPYKLLGVCRHEAHPQFGPAVPPALIAADLQLIKEMGCNYIRAVHYPHDQHFLNLCDELGVLVWQESLGWGQREKQLTNDDFIKGVLKQTDEMIFESYNHPCVILWGFLNEYGSHEKYSDRITDELVALIKKRDSSRLLSFASCYSFEDIQYHKMDVVCINTYPGWYRFDGDTTVEDIFEDIDKYFVDIHAHLKKEGLEDRPYIIGEIGAGAIYGWRDRYGANWSEEYQEKVLKRVCETVVEDERIAGVALWQYCDVRTFRGPGSLFRPRAFNNKGLLDEFRRPKLAWHAVKEIFNRAK